MLLFGEKKKEDKHNFMAKIGEGNTEQKKEKKSPEEIVKFGV